MEKMLQNMWNLCTPEPSNLVSFKAACTTRPAIWFITTWSIVVGAGVCTPCQRKVQSSGLQCGPRVQGVSRTVPVVTITPGALKTIDKWMQKAALGITVMTSCWLGNLVEALRSG